MYKHITYCTLEWHIIYHSLWFAVHSTDSQKSSFGRKIDADCDPVLESFPFNTDKVVLTTSQKLQSFLHAVFLAEVDWEYWKQ